MMIKAFVISLIILFFAPTAHAADQVVILTWERGVEQSITMGGAADDTLWNIELRGKSGKNLAFSRSAKNSAGYYLYTLRIPNDFPMGRYEVYASALNRPAQLTSYVDIVERNSFEKLVDSKKFGYLSTVAFAIFSVIATARKEDFQFEVARRVREDEEHENEKSDPLSVDYKENVTTLEKRGLLDRIGFGRIGWMAQLDATRFLLSQHLPRVSPLAGRYISDGSWLQAILGPVAILLPLAGIATGAALALDTDMTRTLVPANLTLVFIGLVIGIMDALAGLLLAGTYMLWALVSGNLVNAIDLRTVLAIAIIFSAPLLIVGKIRPLRREPEIWTFPERLTDIVVVGVLAVVIVRALFVSLDILSRQETLLATYASYFSVIAGVAIAIRYLLEDVAERLAPARLNYLVPTATPEQEVSYFIGAVLIKVSAFILFLFGFFGLSWQLLVGIATLAIIELLKPIKDSFPNSPFLYQLLPSGIPQIVFMALLGVLVTSWVESLPLVSQDRAQTIFVLISIPAFLISILRFFGRNPHPGDVKWYCRPRFRFVYFLFGPIAIAAALGLQLGVFL